ncbi:3-oxoacyl-ACP synthase [Nocardia brasiliensis]|nr:3-oxoacyl-ACP synthase [Nocardia brasiliensis]
MGRFLPGEPVSNDQMDTYVGRPGPSTRALKNKVLTNSGITTRHYALDQQQKAVWSNTRMCAKAVNDAIARSEVSLADIQFLAAATTVGDVIMPGLASLVHGELKSAQCEVISTYGGCNAGTSALQTAHLHVGSGTKNTAVVVASECNGRIFKNAHFDTVATDTGELPMEAAFLRYMLSDGAGAAILRDQPASRGVSLRIDWISLNSYAHVHETCMYLGSASDAPLRSWWDYPSAAAAEAAGALAWRQNLHLIPEVVRVCVEDYEGLWKSDRIDPYRIRWMPAHYSNERLKGLLLREFSRRGIPVPPSERWYSNLTRVGNIGSAAIFVILEEMLARDLIEAGDTLLCFVPESARFSVAYVHLTAVTADD